MTQEPLNCNQLASTSNATPTLLFNYTPINNSSGGFTANIVARRVSDGATKNFNFSGSHKKFGTAAPSASAELLKLGGTSGDLLALLLAQVSITVNGNDVEAHVTGLSGTNMIWYGNCVGDQLVD